MLKKFFAFTFGYVIAAMVALLIFGGMMGLFRACNNPKTSGIFLHDSTNASYIAGDACIINATPDISEVEMLDLYMWCSVKHMQYLSGLKDGT